MADNVTIPASGTGSATPSIATDDVGGVHYQRVKIDLGGDGAASPLLAGQQAKAASLPVTLASDEDTINVADSAVAALLGTIDTDTGNIATNAATIAGAVSGTEMQVDIVSSALPTGAATAANQSTIIGHVDGLEALLTTIDADTSSMATNLGTLAGAVAGTEVQVDIVSSALPTGAATAANQTTLIGHVDGIEALLGTIDADTSAINTNIATLAGAVKLEDDTFTTAGEGFMVFAVRNDTGGTFAGQDGDYTPFQTDSAGSIRVTAGIEHAEDSAHTTTDLGVMALGVRQDSDAAFGADGDYGPLQLDDNGYLKVNIKAGAGSGGTASTDDGAFTAGSGSGTPAMGFFSADTVDAGDVGVLAMDASRRLLVSIEADNAGIGGGTQFAEDAAHQTGDVGTVALAVRRDTAAVGSGTDGDYSTLNVDGSGRLWSHDPVAVALLGTIDADTSALAGAVSGSEVQVDIVSSALPSGAATAANQTTIIGHVDGIETLLGTMDADTSALAAAVKAEDAAHTTGDTGIPALAVQQTSDAALAGTTGDYAPLQVDENGFLKVNIKAGAGSGGTASTDDSAFTPASGSGTPIMGFADETSPDSVDEGDVGVVRMTLARGLHVNLRNSAGTELATGSGAIDTDVLRVVLGNNSTIRLVDGNGDSAMNDTANAVSAALAPGGNNAVRLEDAAHSSGEPMVSVGGVRQDGDTSPVSADGDYHPFIFDDAGNLKVNIKAGAGSGGTASTDDAAFTAGSGSGTPMMGFASSDTVDSGDVGVLAMSTARDLHTMLMDGAGNPVSVTNSTVSVLGYGLATRPIPFNATDFDTGGGTQNVQYVGLAFPASGGAVNVDGFDLTGADALAVAIVDGDGNQITSFGGGTQYTEDAAVPTNPVGTAMMMERDDILGGLTPAAGDWTHPFATAEGALWTQDFNSDAMLALLGTIDTDTGSIATNAATIAGAVTGSEMQVDIVSGTVTANLSATDNAVLDTIETNTDFGTVVGGGTETGALRVTIANNSTGVVSVDDGGGALTVDGTVGVSGTVTVDLGSNNDIQGQGAHDAAITGNPVRIGGTARTDNIADVAAGDAVDILCDTQGKQVVLVGGLPQNIVSGLSNMTDNAADDIIAAPGAGLRILVTSVAVTNAHASVSTKVSIRDGTTAKITQFAAAAGGGFTLSNPAGLFLATANTAVTAICGTTGADVDVSISGIVVGN